MKINDEFMTIKRQGLQINKNQYRKNTQAGITIGECLCVGVVLIILSLIFVPQNNSDQSFFERTVTKCSKKQSSLGKF